MALLSKFIVRHQVTPRYPLVASSPNPLLISIIANLQTVLQSRRTLSNSHKTGLNDFSEQLIDAPLMARLCEDIATQITQHEPRLSAVNVKLIKTTGYLWQLAVSAVFSHTMHDKSAAQSVCFTLELYKPAYARRLNDVPVVSL